MQNDIQSKLNSDNTSINPVEETAELKVEDLLAKRLRARKEKQRKRKRRVVAVITVILLLVVLGLLVYYSFSPSLRPKVNLTVKTRTDQSASTDSHGSTSPDDVANQAVAEALGAIKPAGRPASQSPGSQPAGPPSLASVSKEQQPDKQTSTGQTDVTFNPNLAQPEPQVVSHRSNEHSIRFSQPPAPAPAFTMPVRRADTAASTTGQPQTARIAQTLPQTLSASLAPPPPNLPEFGALLPVRLLGTIYTLRSGTARLELTRDVKRDGWSLRKGTVLVASVSGGERDRAFLSLTGFIDPDTNRLVKLSGETLGSDGASGLKGKRHKLSSGWSRAFARIGSSAINVAGAVAAGRISGQPVIVTDLGSRSINPVTSEVDGVLFDQSDGRGFVEVPASTTGFVLVTQLPETESRPGNSQLRLADASQPLGDAELADLLTSGDRNRIQAALPRMTPQMRRLAQAVINDPGELR